MAEWLCSGLQSRGRRFDPDPSLQIRFQRCFSPSRTRLERVFRGGASVRSKALSCLTCRVSHRIETAHHGLVPWSPPEIQAKDQNVMQNHSEIVEFLWKVADLIKDDYDAKDYEAAGRVQNQ